MFTSCHHCWPVTDFVSFSTFVFVLLHQQGPWWLRQPQVHRHPGRRAEPAGKLRRRRNGAGRRKTADQGHRGARPPEQRAQSQRPAPAAGTTLRRGRCVESQRCFHSVSKTSWPELLCPPLADDAMDFEMEEAEDEEGAVPLKRQKVMEKCKFWPVCKSGDECLYHHPTTQCKWVFACLQRRID